MEQITQDDAPIQYSHEEAMAWKVGYDKGFETASLQTPTEKYWRGRCEAAEEVMETIPPDVNWGNLGAIKDHEETYLKWSKLKSTPIPILTPCVELEKEVERLKGELATLQNNYRMLYHKTENKL